MEISPVEVCTVLSSFIETHEPFYDYKNRMQTLVRRLSELGCRSDAIGFCDKLRSMPGLEELFYKLTASS